MRLRTDPLSLIKTLIVQESATVNCCGWKNLCKKGIACLLVVCIRKRLLKTFRRGSWWSVVASASKDKKTRPRIVRISPVVGWPYCAEVTPHIGQALRPKTLSTVPRWCLTADRHLRVFYCEFGNLCAEWCPIYSPNSLLDVSLCSTDSNSVNCSCKTSPNLKIRGNATRFFRIWYKTHSAAFLHKKSGFRECWFVVWLVRSGLQLSGDTPHRLGAPHGRPKRAQWKQ